QGDLAAIGNVFDMANKTPLSFPNRPLDPAKLPLNVDLGHFPIIIEHYPACFDEQCTMSGWRSTLKIFATWDKDTLFVPGHGQICGQDGIQNLRNVFDDLSEQAEKMRKAGVPLSDAVDQYVIPEKFKSYGVFAWGFCISGAISKLYAEIGAK